MICKNLWAEDRSFESVISFMESIGVNRERAIDNIMRAMLLSERRKTKSKRLNVPYMDCDLDAPVICWETFDLCEGKLYYIKLDIVIP